MKAAKFVPRIAVIGVLMAADMAVARGPGLRPRPRSAGEYSATSAVGADQGNVILPNLLPASGASSVLYVDTNAPGSVHDGLSWCSAYTAVQDALAHAAASGGAVTEIRVAQGVYKADQGAYQTPGDREATFQLLNDVTLRGGFAGCVAPNPDEQDTEAFEVILAGHPSADAEPNLANNTGQALTAQAGRSGTILNGVTIVDCTETGSGTSPAGAGGHDDECIARLIDVPFDANSFVRVSTESGLSGPLFFAVSYHGEFSHIDASVGEVPPMRHGLPYSLQALAAAPSGVSYTISYFNYPHGLYEIDPQTGDIQYLFNPPTVYPVRGMAFSPDEKLYVTVHRYPGKTYLGVVDIEDGSYHEIARLRIADGGPNWQADGLDFSPDGMLYGTVGGRLYTIDLDDAEMHEVGDGDRFLQSSFSLVFTPDNLLFVVGRDEEYRSAFTQVDPLTGDRIGTLLRLSADYRGLACVPTTIAFKQLDIKPGSCPNPLSLSSQGYLPIAVVGTEGFDVTTIDVTSVRLLRADGAGGEVAPNEGPPGPHSVFEDVATPFGGAPCDCHDLTGDGLDDLSMKFSTQDVVAALELGGLTGGDAVELVLTGTLLDGTSFTTGSDCVVIVPVGNTAVRARPNSPGSAFSGRPQVTRRFRP